MASEYARLRDEFFLAANVRPATAEHYVAWLEEFLDRGGKINNLSTGIFAQEEFVTVSSNAEMPQLEGNWGLKVIVPPGVKLVCPKFGNSVIYTAEDGRSQPDRSPAVWTEMLDMLVNDGFPLSQVAGLNLDIVIGHALVGKIAGKGAMGKSFYDAFTEDEDFPKLDKMLTQMRALKPAKFARSVLQLDEKTPIDAPAQAIIDRVFAEATKTLEMVHYRHNPANKEPIPAFGRRKKPPPEPKVELEEGIRVNSPLRLKDQTP